MKTCDMCKANKLQEYMDAKTKFGMWGNLCPSCFKKFGIKLGTGFGQRYVFTAGKYVKVEG